MYFIRDLKWVKIPWDRVRDELGYREGFVPQGHTIVAEDKVRRVIEKYGGVEEFLEALSGGFSVGGVSERFNPYLLQGLMHLNPDRYVAVLGKIVRRIAARGSWSKREIMEFIEDCLKDEGLPRSSVDELVNPKMPNDLRRLGLISAGDPVGSWSAGVEARVSEFVGMAGGLGDDVIAGAVAFALAVLSPRTPCAELLRMLWDEGEAAVPMVVERIAGEVRASRSRVEELVRRELELVMVVKEVLRGAPKALLPLELWRMGS